MGAMVKVTLKGMGYLSMSKEPGAEEGPNARRKDEGYPEWEERIWRDRGHWDQKTGLLYVPAINLMKCVHAAAAYEAEKIKGKGMKTWTERFRSGVTCVQNLVLRPEITRETVSHEWVYCHAQGNAKKGGGRVWRCFPMVYEWGGETTFHVLDDFIGEDVFRKYLEIAGLFIGLGRFAPRVGGIHGRYEVKGFEWLTKAA